MASGTGVQTVAITTVKYVLTYKTIPASASALRILKKLAERKIPQWNTIYLTKTVSASHLLSTNPIETSVSGLLKTLPRIVL